MLFGLLWSAHYTWSSTRIEANWEPLDYFIGEWTGEESGAPGPGTGRREYRRIMGGRFLYARNVSRFEPQDASPAGGTHEEWSFISYDESANRFVLREFHSEGYVNRYRLTDASRLDSTDTPVFVFESVAIENLPLGSRARLTIRIESEDRFNERFELARPDEEYESLIQNRWMRVNKPPR